MDAEQLLTRVVSAYETLEPDSLPELLDLYALDASFKDPFNEVRGRQAIVRIFSHMFVQVDRPRFVVTHRFPSECESAAMLLWDFHFRTRGWGARDMCIRGATHLQFDPAGLIKLHRDYWDAAEELYAKLPLLGALMRLLQRAGRA